MGIAKFEMAANRSIVDVHNDPVSEWILYAFTFHIFTLFSMHEYLVLLSKRISLQKIIIDIMLPQNLIYIYIFSHKFLFFKQGAPVMVHSIRGIHKMTLRVNGDKTNIFSERFQNLFQEENLNLTIVSFHIKFVKFVE